MGFKYFKVGLQFLAGTSFDRLGNFHGHFYICFLAQSPELFALCYLQRCGVVWLEWVPRRGRKWGPGPASRQLSSSLQPWQGLPPPAGFRVIALLAKLKGTLPLHCMQLHILRFSAILLVRRKGKHQAQMEGEHFHSFLTLCQSTFPFPLKYSGTLKTNALIYPKYAGDGFLWLNYNLPLSQSH